MKMADSGEGAGFWLPSQFFDDFLSDKENLDDTNVQAESDSEFCFPAEFPYENHAGGWSDGTKDAVEDLIYRAAGQVSKMKLYGGDVTRPAKNTGPFVHPRSLDQVRPAARNPNHSAFQNVYQHMAKQQKQGGGIWYSDPQMYETRSGREMGQDAWPVHLNPTRIVGSGHRAVMLGGSVGGVAVKRKSAGTGVFLPRRFGNINDCNAYSDSHKTPGYSAAFAPENNVYILNKNVNNMNGFVQSRPRCHPNFTRGFNPEYDFLMARRNSLMFATPAKFATRRLVSEEPWLVPSSRADIGSFPVL